jgi:predicted Na+-dependent transporter
MTRQRCQSLGAYRELLVVAAAAVLGLTVQSPLGQVARHQGIDVVLVILVLSAAITIEPKSLRQLLASWRPLALALLVGASALPTLSWLVAHLVSAGPLREGVTTIGLAPCEIASIATTAMAGGDVALAGGMLIGSTILTVSLAGPILAVEQSGGSVHPGHIIVNLLLIVAAPLAVGLAIRSQTELPRHGQVTAATTSTITVGALVALVASEVHLSGKYLMVLIAILVFLLVSAIVGRIIGRTGGQPQMRAVLLTTSMRDFAIAAALATAAFGPAAAAPLGLYGIIVLIWGTGGAGFMRARHSQRSE